MSGPTGRGVRVATSRRTVGALVVGVLVLVAAPVLVAVAFAALGLFGDEVAGSGRIAVTRSAGGDLQVSYLACPGEQVREASVERTSDGDERGEVIWAVEALGQHAGRQDLPVTRAAPEGYANAQWRVEGPPRGGELHAVVESSERGSVPLTFLVDDVREGMFLVRGGDELSEAAFQAAGEETCDPT